MKLTRKLATAALAVIATVGMSIGLGASPAQAATNLGGVSVQGACNNQFPGTTAVPLYSNVYGWRCRIYYSYGPYYFSGIDLTRQCRAQYGSGAYANYVDYNNPYSWRCYR